PRSHQSQLQSPRRRRLLHIGNPFKPLAINTIAAAAAAAIAAASPSLPCTAILKSVELPFFCSTQFPLQIRARSGSSDLLESENIHRDQESGKILNLVFVWANESSELKVDVSVVFKGEDVCPEESEEKQEALLVATVSLFSLLFLCVRGWIFTECGRMNWKGKGG
ncbi:hypothetical protein DVH24_009854, partial [Malus domestica]